MRAPAGTGPVLVPGEGRSTFAVAGEADRHIVAVGRSPVGRLEDRSYRKKIVSVMVFY